MEKHLIFTNGRSGSNYLSNTLNLSPECLNYGEILGEWTIPYKLLGKHFSKDGNTKKYLDIIYKNRCYFELAQLYSIYSHLKGKRLINYKKHKQIKTIGIKDFLVTMERQNCFDYFQQNNDIKIIYLHRDNILQRYISGVFMGLNRTAVSYKAMNVGTIVLDTDEVLKKLNIFEQETQRGKNFIGSLSDHQVLDIEYQDYFENPNATRRWNAAIFEFLSIKPATEMSEQKKIVVRPLKDSIKNYDELLDAIRGTPYEKYLY
jgi:Sulfotransferase family